MPPRPPKSPGHPPADAALARVPGAGAAITIHAGAKGVNPALVYHNAKLEGSRPAIRCVLNRIAGWLVGGGVPATWEQTIQLPWWELRNRHVMMIRARLIESGAAPRSINRDMSLLRSVLHVAWANEQMTTDQYMRAVDVKGVEKDTTKVGRALAVEELKALFDACDDASGSLDPRVGRRKAAAILAIAYGAGLRRVEIARLEVEGIDARNHTVTVLGKRNKRRTVFLDPGWFRYIDRWLQVRGPGESPRLFRIGPWTVWKIVEKVREAAGVEPFTPHDLRRSFSSHLLAAGKDLALLKELMGHSDIRTTMIYDRRDEVEQKKAVTAISPESVGLDD